MALELVICVLSKTSVAKQPYITEEDENIPDITEERDSNIEAHGEEGDEKEDVLQGLDGLLLVGVQKQCSEHQQV